MEDALKNELGLEFVRICGHGYGTNTTETVETDRGRMFIKYGKGEFLAVGEFESLKAILNTHAIRCPNPISTIHFKDDWALVTSFETMHKDHEGMEKFAEKLARLHMHNPRLIAENEKRDGFVGENDEMGVRRFGFHVPTCCGSIPQNNEWADDWPTFFIRNRLQSQINRLIEKGDRSLLDKQDLLYRAAEKLLLPRKDIAPSLVHGDLWSGNWSCVNNEPIIFDPSASYSDPEFEQGIMNIFGGVTTNFYSIYYSIVPDQIGRERRVELYELYHLLNHWNHFGSGYKRSSMDVINKLIRQ
ncbi:unnamed protein product [Caenorhabditis bovis]|uniref:protein-ribulosamine 3-kinase n=1 Tax=Caenorhabditis bovis TaxID=2654633 RepID=A0A8S1F045_9PELO|nr:unnamed protein product [Caenorhabditis bovis]